MDPSKQTDWERLAEAATETERLARWTKAYKTWIENLQACYSQNAWEDAQHAWKEFTAEVHKPAWEVKQEDVDRYQKGLVEHGLAASTIRIRLMHLKRFYDFCVQSGVDNELAKEGNPFDQVEWPKVRSYVKPTYLQRADERKFLRTIQRDPSVIGRRDYALFMMLLSTGREAGQIRRLRWGDLAFEDNQAWMAVKGSNGRVALAEAIWIAIKNWLTASGRLERMEAGDFVFAPSKEPLVKEAGLQAEDWASERPLSPDEVHYLLKLYAGWAGLNEEEVTCHTLRNTAALRKFERGESMQSIQASMGRKSAAETRKYFKKLTENGQAVGHSRKRLIRRIDQTPARKPGRAQPGNRLNLWHGYYAKSLPEMQALEQAGIHLELTDRAIVRQRFVLRRILILSGEIKSVKKAVILLSLASKTASRVANLIYRKWRDGDPSD